MELQDALVGEFEFGAQIESLGIVVSLAPIRRCVHIPNPSIRSEKEISGGMEILMSLSVEICHGITAVVLCVWG